MLKLATENVFSFQLHMAPSRDSSHIAVCAACAVVCVSRALKDNQISVKMFLDISFEGEAAEKKAGGCDDDLIFVVHDRRIRKL